jgi:hypothetical protein
MRFRDERSAPPGDSKNCVDRKLMPRPQIHLLACTLLALGPWGCVHTTEWVDDEPPRSYGPLDKARREPGYGKFAAFDFGNHIVVYATGYECSTPGGTSSSRNAVRTGAGC